MTEEHINIGQLRFNLYSYDRPHTHDEPPKNSVRYLYILQGAITLTAGDQPPVAAQAQDVVYIPDGCRYCSDWQKDSEIFVVDVGLTDTVTQEHYGDLVRILYRDRKGTLLEPIGRLREICSYSEPYLWMERVSILMHILCEIAREQEAETQRHSLIRQSVVYLNANYMKETSVEHLAELCSFSESHYRRLFKEYYGMSPVEYRSRLRVRQAQKLLQGGSTVTRAAEAVGIRDPAYFARLYKKYTGHTPGEEGKTT